MKVGRDLDLLARVHLRAANPVSALHFQRGPEVRTVEHHVAGVLVEYLGFRVRIWGSGTGPV